MSVVAPRGRLQDNDNLILTPAKLRLHSGVFGTYVTSVWLPHAIFAGLLLWKIGHGTLAAWWMVFLPQWIGHACHLVLVLWVLLNLDNLITQQLGPPPPARASPGMMMQYTTMFAERRASLLVDNVSALIENLAGVIVKGMICKALSQEALLLPTFSWRLLLLPCWVAWGLTFIVAAFKPRKERTVGSMRDLLFICLLFVALKLDGIAAYTWSVVFLIPWMWFGALLLGAIVTACVVLVAYTCMDLRELALPCGFLLLLLSASTQLPFFIYLCNYLDGDQSVTVEQILIPQIASWSAMWLSGMIICYGLWKKEKLRAELASSGQVWTAHESAARELMSLELEDMQQQVDKMSNEELAQVAVRMMAGKAQPQQLLRVGSTLYRHAMSFTSPSPKGSGISVVKRPSDTDGTAHLADLSAVTAMEEGQQWPDHAKPSSEGGTVHVSIQLLQMPSTIAPTTVQHKQSSGTNSSEPQQCASHDQQHSQQQHGLPIVRASDLVEAVVTTSTTEEALLPSQTPAEPEAQASSIVPDADDGLCTICCDHEACCVFMECGHGGYCWRCAHVLFARPPSECPICRQPIQQVVELEDKACQVGRPAKVKQLRSQESKPRRTGSWFSISGSVE